MSFSSSGVAKQFSNICADIGGAAVYFTVNVLNNYQEEIELLSLEFEVIQAENIRKNDHLAVYFETLGVGMYHHGYVLSSQPLSIIHFTNDSKVNASTLSVFKGESPKLFRITSYQKREGTEIALLDAKKMKENALEL